MSAIGRLLPLRSGRFRLIECPLSAKADIHPSRVSVYRPKAAIRQNWARISAIDPKRTPNWAESIFLIRHGSWWKNRN